MAKRIVTKAPLDPPPFDPEPDLLDLSDCDPADVESALMAPPAKPRKLKPKPAAIAERGIHTSRAESGWKVHSYRYCTEWDIALELLGANLEIAGALCRAHELGGLNEYAVQRAITDEQWWPGCARPAP